MNWRFAEVGWRLLPGGIASLLLAGLLHLCVLSPFEQVAYQCLFRLRGETGWDDRLVLVKIDDASIKALGLFPWSRQRYVELLNKLNKAQASVVAFDLLFSEPSPDDNDFAQAIQRSGGVVLAQAEDHIGQPLLPVPALRDQAIGSGHILVRAESDGMIRKIEPQSRGNLALGIAAIAAYSFKYQVIPQPNPTQSIWLNWAGPVNRIQQYSFADVIQGKVDDRTFRNKLVLVGVTASATDAAPTPFDQNPPANGVHLQATLIHNLFQQNALRPIGKGWLALLLLIAGPGLSFCLSFWRTEIQVSAMIGLSLGWISVGLGLLTVNYLLPTALPVGLFLTTAIVTALTERLRMNLLLQQQIKQIWQRYAPDVSRPLPMIEVKPTQPLTSATAVQRVTQLAALADLLGRSQSTQVAIARSLSIGVVAADFDGLVWFCNPIAAKLLNLEVGNHLELSLVPDWLSEQEWQQARTNLQRQRSMVSKEQSFGDYWFCLQLEPLTYQPNQTQFQLDGFLVLIEDVTEHKKIEVNLDQQVNELHRMSQLKDEFLSTVSHELRTPLTNMKMAIQLLKVANAKEQQNHYLKILENECAREAELINELLDLQRLESGKQSILLEPIDLQTWLPELVEPFYKRTEARQQNLTVHIDPDLPYLKSDRASMERIVVELTNNACKYTPPNHEIVVAAEWSDPYVELMVSNSGVEIPAKELSRIFEQFYRVPQADPWKQGGTGLGLAIIKKLIERLSGKIAVVSENGWTSFTVQLPLNRERS